MILFPVKLVQSSILPSYCTAKYVAYLCINHQHKNILLSHLSQSQITIFLTLLNYDPEKAIHLFKKKMLIDLPLTICQQYNIKELEKIYMLSLYSPDLSQILPFCNLQKLTKHNVADIVRYYYEYNKLRINVVEWGPGNHIDINTNIEEHYIKHVLSNDSNESIYWRHISSFEEYKIEAQNMFQNMERVVIHSNGKLTYMSGFHKKYFIVGRYHHGVFGISSCYYVPSGEKLGRYIDQCIKL